MARAGIAIALLALVAGSQAAWEIVGSNLATVLMGVSAPGPDPSTVYISGGENGGGATVLKSVDGGVTYESLPHDAQVVCDFCFCDSPAHAFL